MINWLLQNFRAALSKEGRSRDNPASNWLRTVLLTSVGVTGLVLGMRELKWLQPLEMSAYDQMLRLRPPEAPDGRILLVTITEEDLQRQQKSILPDETYNTLLAKLESYQPRVIGLNVFRDLPEEPGNQELRSRLQTQDNIIALCRQQSPDAAEIAPPPTVPIERVGFSTVLPDEDNVIRRSLIFGSAQKGKCSTRYSFASQLAFSYLAKEKIKAEIIGKEERDFQVGKAVFYTLRPNSGSYKNLDDQGYQILLNYREPSKFAQQVTLTEVLTNQVNPDLVKDRLVIIGTTAPSVDKGFLTPYSAGHMEQLRMPGVLIQAQITSQIISAVLDGRPLIWYLPEWGEVLWIWGWALVGGVLACQLRHPLLLAVVGGTTLTGLHGICAAIFLKAGWVPVVPPAISLVVSIVSVMAYSAYKMQQQQQKIMLQVQQQQDTIDQLSLLIKETTEIQDLHRHSQSEENTSEKSEGDSLLGGRYKVLKGLSSGGFGYTYLAEDTQRPGNPVCVVKHLMPARRDTRFLEVARRLFHTEAEILEALGKHNQIPELLAYFEVNKEFYLVQEFIDGHPLSDELATKRPVENERVVIDILQGILEILTFVHENRVIHRDIKPSNIIRRKADNRLVLIDFGAVKLMQSPNSEETELSTVAIGTRGYSPPEQLAGHPRLCSDIYALGMMGIQALTGIPPQELKPNTNTGNIMWRNRARVSEDLAVILDKMVRYNFYDRYQTAAEVLQDLKLIVKS